MSREEVFTYAKMSYDNGLTVGTSGNVSMKKGNVMYITPSALPYNEMVADDILQVDIETGEILDGTRKASSETPMHRYIYLKNPEINAIVHTHSTYATIFACAHMPIPPVHYTIADIGKSVPVAPYAKYGTEALAEHVVNTLQGSNGVLLANHGVVAVGENMGDAYRRAEVIEEVAHLAYGSHTLGSVNPLTNAQLDDARQSFKTYTSN
ncbi:L-fuculose-phosphate aldolase [Lentibacillus sp. JNUCC-1]|uniref:class II aldolase/adducin family protein n=1 Tax=Lentibacillus sp. JNUCC-1 TaxID=2654513 RepID=UPI0012E743FC|nr:class II aldolase/adducin family protein [Lentibacillus sp. JNUCC-1]MUV36967.1 L-fuculose-phosphate aldolase [Lentibacillus sp. JNUCC-1]